MARWWPEIDYSKCIYTMKINQCYRDEWKRFPLYEYILHKGKKQFLNVYCTSFNDDNFLGGEHIGMRFYLPNRDWTATADLPHERASSEGSDSGEAERRAAACRPRATLFAPVRPVDLCITFHTRSRISAYLTYVRPHRPPESQPLRVHRHAVLAGAG